MTIAAVDALDFKDQTLRNPWCLTAWNSQWVVTGSLPDHTFHPGSLAGVSWHAWPPGLLYGLAEQGTVCDHDAPTNPKKNPDA